MSGRFEGQVAVVTGGGGPNIGRGIVIRLAEEGADIVIADIDLEQAQQSAREVERLGRRTHTIEADVRAEEACEAFAEAALQTFGRLDILVASAGIGYEAKPVLERSLEEWRHMLDINLTGLMLTNRSCARRMIESGRPGAIVNIASSSTFIAKRGGAHYQAAKAGVWMLTKTLALELGEYGIRVNAIAPGWIVTPEKYEARPSNYKDAERDIPLGRIGTPRDVGNAAVFLASEEAAYITGEIICVDGGRFADSRP